MNTSFFRKYSTPFFPLGIVVLVMLVPILFWQVAQAEDHAVLVLHDNNLDGVPDEVAALSPSLRGDFSCPIEDTTCALAVAHSLIDDSTTVRLRGKKKCPVRKVVVRGRVIRQHLSSAAKKKCKKPTKKPTATPTPTPTSGGEPAPGPQPDLTRTPAPEPTKAATATPTRTATPTPPTTGGGNAATGKSFYSQVCLSCHGVKAGKSEQQILSAMSTVSDHSSVRGLVTLQVAKDVAAYLATVR